MNNKKLLSKVLTSVMAATLIITMPNVITVRAAEIDCVQSSLMDGIELNGGAGLESYDDNLTNVDFSDSEELIESRAGIGVRYWGYNTCPYEFEKQKWSTNVDIYDTYASTNEAEYLNPKFTYMMINPTSWKSYNDAIREGYIRQEGELQSFQHTVSDSSCNNVLLMMDDNIIYDIFEKDTLKSVFSNESSSLIGGTTDTKTIDNRHKELVNIQLRNGTYLIVFGASDVTAKNHYALYTGCPLPLLKTSMHAGTHNGVVHWNGGGLKAENEKICPAVSISVPSGVDPGLFMLTGIWFENKAVSGSQDLYVSDVTYYYKSPANSSYRVLSEQGGYHGNLYDNSPSRCSVQGSYGTKFRVSWASNLAYVNAAYYANTMMHLEYLIPYGLYQGM